MNPDDLVQLTTGAVVSRATVTTTMISLRELFSGELGLGSVVAIPDLIALARDPGYNWAGSGESRRILTNLSLIDETGKLHAYTRAVILAAIEGEEGNTRLVSPVE